MCAKRVFVCSLLIAGTLASCSGNKLSFPVDGPAASAIVGRSKTVRSALAKSFRKPALRNEECALRWDGKRYYWLIILTDGSCGCAGMPARISVRIDPASGKVLSVDRQATELKDGSDACAARCHTARR